MPFRVVQQRRYDAGMDLMSDQFPAPNCPPSSTAEQKLEALRAALATCNIPALEPAQQALAERINQAARKINSGMEIQRTSELMSLAQFGPASIGTAVALAFDDKASAPIAQATCVARFLVEVVFAGARSPSLIPGDLLKEHGLSRAEISWPSSAPIYSDLLSRATDTIARADDAGGQVNSPPLQKLLAKHRMLTLRQIAKLRSRDPSLARTRLTTFDKFVIEIKLLLRIQVAS